MKRDRNHGAPRPAENPPDSKSDSKNVPPLKPRRNLFVALLLGFLLWVGLLLTMYFTTVYPQRHPSAGAAPTSRPNAPR